MTIALPTLLTLILFGAIILNTKSGVRVIAICLLVHTLTIFYILGESADQNHGRIYTIGTRVEMVDNNRYGLRYENTQGLRYNQP